MTAPELLNTLASRGITLAAEGDRLRVKAPVGALTVELRQALAEHKAELLALVRQRGTVYGADAEPKGQQCPVNAGQGRILCQTWGPVDELVTYAVNELDADLEAVEYDPDHLPADLAQKVAELEARITDLEDRARRGQEWIARQRDPAKRSRGEARLREIGDELYQTYEELGRLPIAWGFPGCL